VEFSLIIPAFFAGVLTFLAPCTLPLVPGYLGFISGVGARELGDPLQIKSARRKIFLGGLMFVLGFSAVFILLGSLFGLGGAALIRYRIWLSRIGGLFVIFFGLFMIGLLRLPALHVEKRVRVFRAITPGHPSSAFIFGATFALGWTPCVGPILGSILTLAAASSTVGQGAFLLAVFSLGLAVPFLLLAAGIGSASATIAKISTVLPMISVVGGIFLLVLGALLLTDNLGLWVGTMYQWLSFIRYDRLLDYL